MKKLIFGLALMLLGGLSSVMLLAGAMQTTPSNTGGMVYDVWQALSLYRLTGLLAVAAIIGVAGLALALWEMAKKE